MVGSTLVTHFRSTNIRIPGGMGFRSLRVVNEDRVVPGGRFPMHPHRDMEIIPYVLEGALAHKDSMGNGSIIRPGDGQRMSAGTGVRHSEANPSSKDPVHLLQIWILPDRRGHEPGYEQKSFPEEEKRGHLRLVASPDGADGSVTIHQDAKLYVSLLSAGQHVEHELSPGRFAWLQIAKRSGRAEWKNAEPRGWSRHQRRAKTENQEHRRLRSPSVRLGVAHAPLVITESANHS